MPRKAPLQIQAGPTRLDTCTHLAQHVKTQGEELISSNRALPFCTRNRASRSSFLPLAISKRQTSIVFKDKETFILILLPRARFLTHTGAMVRSPAAAEITYLTYPFLVSPAYRLSPPLPCQSTHPLIPPLPCASPRYRCN
jgi:hypothetical protein